MHTSAPRAPRLVRGFREPANSLTHLVGILLSLAAAATLLVLAAGDPWRLAAFTVYGTSLVALYTASTLLHAVHAGPTVLRRLRVLDHAAIFVFIAGTYTPVTLLALRDVSPAWAWSLFTAVWCLAGLGVGFKLIWIGAPRWLSVALYVALGWLVVVVIVPLAQALATGPMLWMIAGGVAYTVGAIVYALGRPDPWPARFGYHALWHLFVLAGSACHFVMILTATALA